MRLSLKIAEAYEGHRFRTLQGEIHTCCGLIFGRFEDGYGSSITVNGTTADDELNITLRPACGAYADLGRFSLKHEADGWIIKADPRQNPDSTSFVLLEVDGKEVPEGA